MQREDLRMMLGQADELGNTLMKNRVLKQQEQERKDLLDQRDRFQTQDNTTRNRAIDVGEQARRDETAAQLTTRNRAIDVGEQARRDETAAQLQIAGERDQTNRDSNTGKTAAAQLKASLEMMSQQSKAIQSSLQGLSDSARSMGPKGDQWAQQTLSDVINGLPPELVPHVKQTFAAQLAPGYSFSAVKAPVEPGAGDSVTTSEKIPAVQATKEIPAETNIFGKVTKPAIPAVPARNETTITTRATTKVGKKPLFPQGSQPAANVITDNQGKAWRYKGNAQDPTQDRDPANWEPAK